MIIELDDEEVSLIKLALNVLHQSAFDNQRHNLTAPELARIIDLRKRLADAQR